ncbi:MAG: DsbA family oxidoreductase [Actinomycetota bacterium]
MRVDIWSDIVCPWCYIGKRRFDVALETLDQRDQIEVVHHSFELDPTIERGQTTQLLDMLAAKYRLNPAQASEAEQRVATQAAADGLGYTSDRPVGNTFDAHRLVHLATERGRGEETLQRLYEAHFSEGRSVFDTDALTAVAAEAGLDQAEARRVLADGGYADEVRADEEQAGALGISGVPFFVLDRKYGISGAQPAALIAEALQEAWRRAEAEAEPEPAQPGAGPAGGLTGGRPDPAAS